MNAGMEQYLWVLVKYQQDDWVQWLSLAEYAARNGISESTKYMPFSGIQGIGPQMTFHRKATKQCNERRLNAHSVQATMQQIHEHLQVKMRQSQGVQEEGANRGRTPALNI
jgi:hypothetical protein